MQFLQLEVADSRGIDEVVGLWHTAHHADLPDDPAFCPVWEGGAILHPPPGERYEHWLARDAAGLAGMAYIGFPELDNTGTAYVGVIVHPRARRRGLGRQLWDLTVDRARAEGRKLSMFESKMGSPGEAFARSVGGELGILSARRRLLVDAGTLATCDALWDAALLYAAGYEIHTYVGPVPERWVADMTYLTARMSTDAPMDDLDFEPEVYDVERLRAREAGWHARGRIGYTAVAVHTASGTVVGYTDIGFTDEDPTACHQNDTIVDPAHRGRRLGTLIKVANLRQLLAAQPAVRTILTWNAASNGPMIAVNEAMGFRLWDLWGEWQARL